MERKFGIFALILTLFLSGCANFTPKLNEKIDNQNGKIDEIKNNQNGMILELGKVKQQADIQNSQLKEVQNGLVNLNASVSRNENSGVQILQGDGALIMVFALAVIGMLLYWYRDRAVKSERVSGIMAKEISRFNHPELNDNILRSAMPHKLEQHILDLLKKSI